MCHGIPVVSFKLIPRIKIGGSVKTMKWSVFLKCDLKTWIELGRMEANHRSRKLASGPQTWWGTPPPNCEEVGNEEDRVQAYFRQNIHLWFQKALKVYMCENKNGAKKWEQKSISSLGMAADSHAGSGQSYGREQTTPQLSPFSAAPPASVPVFILWTRPIYI